MFLMMWSVVYLLWLFILLRPSQASVIINGHHYPALIDITLDDLNAGLKRGSFSSADLVNVYTARIKEVNAQLNAVTEINPDAIEIAEALDAERAKGLVRGPLHGIPILIKDNIATDDKMNNTAGSYALLGAKVPRDSTITAKLRKAGAIILGKANLSEWAMFRSNRSSSGWSAYGGQVYGAYHPKQDPSGSSSGSAVAASIGLAFATIGSETDGSILMPSDVGNVVGIKPTVGLTSRYLVIPISEHQDTVGPIARTVKDAAHILQAIAGYDSKDNYTSAIPNNHNIPNYIQACDPNALDGAKFGVARNWIELLRDHTSPPTLAAFEKSLTILRKAGASIEDANFTMLDEWAHSQSEHIVLETDFPVNLATYFAELTQNPNEIHNLAELIEFTKRFPKEEFPSRDVEIWERALALGYNNTDIRAHRALLKDERLGGPGGVLGALERANLDAILLPSQFSSPIPAIAMSPVVTVPMGFYPAHQPIELNPRGNLVAVGPNIPFGLSFLGRRWSEADLISYAYAYEQLTHSRYRVQPYIVPSVELDSVANSLLCSRMTCPIVNQWVAFEQDEQLYGPKRQKRTWV